MTEDDQTARYHRIAGALNILQHLHQQVNSEQSELLDEAMRLIGALDDNAPVLPHNELSVSELRERGASHYRRALQGPLEYILSLFHGEILLRSGEQWTLNFGTSCGFTLDFTIRVKTLGTCVSVPDELMKGDALSHVDHADHEQNLDDLDAADFNTLLQELGLRKIPPPKKPRRSRKQKDDPSHPS